MSFHQYKKTAKFPRDEVVDIHVRLVDLDAESDTPYPCVEIREFIKASECYGHGLVLPLTAFKDLIVAGDTLGLTGKPALASIRERQATRAEQDPE